MPVCGHHQSDLCCYCNCDIAVFLFCQSCGSGQYIIFPCQYPCRPSRKSRTCCSACTPFRHSQKRLCRTCVLSGGHVAALEFFFFFGVFAVFAAFLNCSAVGAPLVPTFLIFSPLPAAIRFRLACMFAYSPFLAITISPYLPNMRRSFCL